MRQAGEKYRQPASGAGRRRVLLLDAGYEALTALPSRRAVILLLGGKVDVVHADPAAPPFRSVGVSVPVPSVIRLRRYVHVPYRGGMPLTRATLMLRDRGRCAYCASRADTIDHVIPRSRGGEHVWDNVVACCARCNHRKADHLLAELGWTLSLTPAAPHGRNWRLVATLGEVDPVWTTYLTS